MLNRFYVDLVKLYKRAEELEEKTAQARYMALQNQLNPHFLFNSLNTLISDYLSSVSLGQLVNDQKCRPQKSIEKKYSEHGMQLKVNL